MPTETKTWTLNVTLPGEEPTTLTQVPESDIRAVLEDLMRGTMPARATAHDVEAHALAA